MIEKIWVIGWDYGVEGKTPPVMAFLDEETAKDAVELLGKNPSATGTYLEEVLIWGGPQEEYDDGWRRYAGFDKLQLAVRNE